MDAHEKQTAEQNLHALTVQKQALQQQLVEVDLALKELATAKTAYRIIGGLMVGAEVQTLQAELQRKKETTQTRLSQLERHQEKLSAKLTQ